MTTRSWIRNLFARTPRRPPTGSREAPARRRPSLQALEDRALLLAAERSFLCLEVTP